VIQIFQLRDSVCARKRDKLYVGEYMVLTIGLRGCLIYVLLVVRIDLKGEDL